MYSILAVIVISSVTQLFVERLLEQNKIDLQQNLASVRSNLEASIFRDAYLADPLATIVTIDPTFAIKHWQFIAEKLLAKANFVQSVALAPNDIIAAIYPFEGNEKALGFNVRTHSNQYRMVKKAQKASDVVIAGPLELVQGGTALIAISPVFTDFPYNKKYWGSVSVVLQYDKLLQNSGIFDQQRLNIALKANSENGLDGNIFFGDAKVIQNADIKLPVNLPYGTWYLYATYKNLSSSDAAIAFKRLFLSLGIITFLCGYILILFLSRSYFRAQKFSVEDELTKIPNRRFLLNELERLMSNRDTVVEFTLLNIDLNGFKQVNDTFGHKIGDELLKYVANKMRSSIRSSDILARIGGDEFVVVLHRITEPADIEHIMSKIHHSVESNSVSLDNKEIRPSLCIGYTTFIGQGNPKKIPELLARADKNMYRNKILRKSGLT